MTMNLERFAALADAYGADLRRWPEAERAGAAALRASDPKAEALLLDQGALDQALDSAPRFQPSAALRSRVLGSAPKPGWRLARVRRLAREWLAPGAGLAAACMAGAWVGLAAAHGVTAQARADAVLVASAEQSSADPEDSGAL